MSTTMMRIRHRLAKLRWVPKLDTSRQAELAIAVADVGDGRAADELAAIAKAWRGLVPQLERIDRRIGRTYRTMAQDLEDRVAVLRAARDLRRLLERRPDLAVVPESVAVERLTSEHDLVLTTVPGLDTAAAVLAVSAWCAELSSVEAGLHAGPPQGEHHLVVSGQFLKCCATRVDAPLQAADPATATLLGQWLPPAGEQTRIAPRWLVQLATTINRGQPVPSLAPRSCAVSSVLGQRPAPTN